MVASFTVEGERVAAEAPEEAVTSEGSDFQFDAPETIAASETTLCFTNAGQSLHEVVIARFPAGSDVDLDAVVEFFAEEEPESPPPFDAPVFVGGVQAIFPGVSQLRPSTSSAAPTCCSAASRTRRACPTWRSA